MEEQTQDPNASRRRLGRGLSALLGNSSSLEEGEQKTSTPAGSPSDANEIHLELIERNPFQPRQEFEPEALKELAESIRKQGVLQPIIVRPFEDRYQLIAGERRLLACRQAGRETISCRVVNADDRTVCEIAIDENLKRRDLNVLEKAQAFQDYLKRFECSVEELASRLSLDRSTVTNMIRLLELCEEAKIALRSGKISAGHARAILTLDEPAQRALCQKIETESLNVRATEREVKEIQKGAKSDDVIPFKKKPGSPDKGNHLKSLEKQLREQFGVKVEIKLRSADKGQVVVHFENNDQFESILQRMRRAA